MNPTTLTSAEQEAVIIRLNNRVLSLEQAAKIAQVTLETVYRERDPKNIAAKCAAERIAKALE